MPPNPIHPEPELNTWHTSEFDTSINGGKMVGNTSMPEFVGCGAGAEDLSALISGMSSSPENKTIQRQSGTMSCWGWYLFYPCDDHERSEEHTSELQSLMRISYAVFCLKKKKYNNKTKQ